MTAATPHLSVQPNLWEVLARAPLGTLRPVDAQLIAPPNRFMTELVLEDFPFTGAYTDDILDMLTADILTGGEIDLMEHSDEEIEAILAPMRAAFTEELSRAQAVLGEPTTLNSIYMEAVQSACWIRQDCEVWLILSDGDQDGPVWLYASVNPLKVP